METTDPVDPSIDVQEAIVRLSRILLVEHSLEEIMVTVTRLARDSIPSTDEASVTLITGDRPRTAAFTGEPALLLDERQYEQGWGPCLDAAASGEAIRLDVKTDRTYPDFSLAAQERGIRSTLSVPLPVPQATVGALNLYSFHDAGFPDPEGKVAGTYAAAAAIAIANAALYADAAALAEQMHQAMLSRAVIDQAKGILMRDNRCSAEVAFSMLVGASNRSNRKLRDIAQSIVDGTARGA